MLSTSISVSSRLTNLVSVLEWFDACPATHVPTPVWLSTKIALAEAFTNAVRHAHRHLPASTLVHIHLRVLRTCLEIEVIDCGEPFDLQTYLKLHPKPPDVESTHGRGVQLMSSIADRLEYQRLCSDRNCLYFSKRYTPTH